MDHPKKDKCWRDAKKRDILSFAKTIHLDIQEYLNHHLLEPQRRPYVSTLGSLDTFKCNNPEIYYGIERRLELNDNELDTLANYLCSRYFTWMIDQKQIYGSVQRLEDVTTFIVNKYNSHSDK